MKREPKRLTGTQGRKSQIKSSTTSLLFYFIIFFDLIVHFVKFFKSVNILSMISHFISWLKPMVDDTRDQGE